MENINEFLTITDIAKLFDLSRQAVDGWLNEGRLEFYRAGNIRRIDPKILIKYLESVGNSPGAMKDFRRDIENCLRQKYGEKAKI
ncbi:DNA-binding protein [Candidatus Atribacteria bacterium 1244-E10-H5-B2]|nr:MAG: DNA-binding protein [Candidatus Atribacteria bacterium 1244-E10-H5-B2]